MSIFTFILGLFGGFFAKLGFDYYHDFISRQQETLAQIAALDAKWQLIEEERKSKSH